MNLKAPPVVHHLQPFDAYSVPKLSDVCLKLLPSRWRELIMLQVGINHAKSISNPGDEILDNSSNVLGVSRNKRKQEPIKKNKKRPSRLPYPEVNSDSNQQTEPIRHRRDEPIDSPLNNQHLSNSSINKVTLPRTVSRTNKIIFLKILYKFLFYKWMYFTSYYFKLLLKDYLHMRF